MRRICYFMPAGQPHLIPANANVSWSQAMNAYRVEVDDIRDVMRLPRRAEAYPTRARP